MTGNEIREAFLKFFESNGHRRVRSSSLVPVGDPTLLFTNAGMNQFKDVFLGLERRDYTRATSVQKCVRAGGKHNDLENVGFTNRHHTFFEMLGNFSFGDYFKKEAIAFAWELITSPKWFGLPKDKLYATIFKGEEGIARDTEAYDHWVSQGVPKDRIYEFGLKDNFWAMGDTGPCGPCSELHYDMGPAASDQGHADCKFGCECGRYIEIWNLVFMQFNRDASGALNPLPKPSIDTGAGLERLAAVLQGKISNFETDLFQPLIRRAEGLTATPYGTNARSDASLRIIADHARAATFIISDGVLPSNEGRGYVLRKIIRRAIRHARLLGTTTPFLGEMVYAVRDLMQEAYPELKETTGTVSQVVLAEERRFAHTLDIGLKKLDELIGEVLRAKDKQTPPVAILPGEKAFMLYDTYGLPRDFIEDACRDQGIQFNGAEFDRAMEAQRERAKASWKGVHKEAASPAYRDLTKTVFEGYTQLESKHCIVRGIFKPGAELTRELKPGEEGEVILDRTPFYAESGGQVGDAGWLYDAGNNAIVADVLGCVMPIQGVRFHRVRARAPLHIGDIVNPAVNREIRESTVRHHTATHLLHAALREILGKHVKQAGSLVAPDHLRFDFSHFSSVADEELQDIEDLINQEVLRNERVETFEDVPLDVALNEFKAIALFGEKYGDKVRVIRIGDFSTELCGGTHTGATGGVGLVKIMREGSVSSGVRRVEAITGHRSLVEFRRAEQVLSGLAGTINVARDELPAAVERMAQTGKQLEKQLDALKRKDALSKMNELVEQVRTVKGVQVISAEVSELDREAMRQLVDSLRQKLGSAVVVLGTTEDGKVALISGVTKDLTGRLHAGKIVQAVARQVGGSGGGRADLAEAGGKDTSALKKAIEGVYGIVEAML